MPVNFFPNAIDLALQFLAALSNKDIDWQRLRHRLADENFFYWRYYGVAGP